jgi:hypothetical protein
MGHHEVQAPIPGCPEERRTESLAGLLQPDDEFADLIAVFQVNVRAGTHRGTRTNRGGNAGTAEISGIGALQRRRGRPWRRQQKSLFDRVSAAVA